MFARLAVLLCAALLATNALAEPKATAKRYGYCQDDITQGFHFYCDPEAHAEKEPEETPAPQPEAQPPKPPTATEEIMAFRKALDEIKHRAVLDPTEENVLAYMEAQKRMSAMAGAFTDQWQRILYKTPELDKNIDFPLTALGSQTYQRDLQATREAVFKKATQGIGLLFVFEDPSSCPLCATQAQIVAQMRDKYSVALLAVSKDGAIPPDIPEAKVDAGQLKALGLDETPLPLLGLVEPKSGAIDVIGAGLLTEDQILERVHVIREIPVGERF